MIQRINWKSQPQPSSAQAIHNTGFLLSCDCVRDFNFPFLLVSILSKILSWYQAIAFIDDPYTGLLGGEQCGMETFADCVASLGTFELDEGLGWFLKNQLIYKQLTGLEGTFGKYEADHPSLCAGPRGSIFDGAHPYQSVSGLLRMRLGYTIHELEQRLKLPSYTWGL